MNPSEVRRLHATLSRSVKRTLFRPSTAPVRLGAEVEVLPVDAGTRRPARLPDTLQALAPLAARQRWRRRTSAKGTPVFDLPDGGRITFEPGGQLEYSSPPCVSASWLIASMQSVMRSIREALDARGIEAVTLGLDPHTPLAEAPRQLFCDRYDHMEEYFNGIGSSGARMMRQTASLQLCIDAGEAPFARYRLLNALAPILTATFANSPMCDGAPAGSPSVRACTWRSLDRRRTGLIAHDLPPEGYVSFALDAPDLMRRTADGAFASLGWWLQREALDAHRFSDHLSMLFPEVRPRGYFEVRSCDAIPLEWCAGPVALLTGAILDRESERTIASLLGAPASEMLECASTSGLADHRLADLAQQTFEIALIGCRKLGEGFISRADIERAESFLARYTARGLAPADEALAALQPVAA